MVVTMGSQHSKHRVSVRTKMRSQTHIFMFYTLLDQGFSRADSAQYSLEATTYHNQSRCYPAEQTVLLCTDLGIVRRKRLRIELSHIDKCCITELLLSTCHANCFLWLNSRLCLPNSHALLNGAGFSSPKPTVINSV